MFGREFRVTASKLRTELCERLLIVYGLPSNNNEPRARASAVDQSMLVPSAILESLGLTWVRSNVGCIS